MARLAGCTERRSKLHEGKILAGPLPTAVDRAVRSMGALTGWVGYGEARAQFSSSRSC